MSSIADSEVINVGDIVFAKQKGQPWWLAKVIELTKAKEAAKKVYKIQFYKSKNEIYVGRKRIETINRYKTADGNVCFKGRVFNMNEVYSDLKNTTELPPVVMNLEKPNNDKSKAENNQQFSNSSLNNSVNESQQHFVACSLQTSEEKVDNSEAVHNLYKSICQLLSLQNNFNEIITKQNQLLKTIRVGLEQVESLDLKEEIDEVNEIYKRIQRKIGENVQENSLKRKSDDSNVFIPSKKTFFIDNLTEMNNKNITPTEMNQQNPISKPSYQQNYQLPELNQQNYQLPELSQQNHQLSSTYQPNSSLNEMYRTNSVTSNYTSINSNPNPGTSQESDEDGIRRAIFDAEKLLSKRTRNDEAVFNQIGLILGLLNCCNSKPLTEGVLRLMKLIQMWKPSPKTLSRCKECFYLYCNRFYIQNGTEKVNLHENDVVGRVQMVFKFLSTGIPNIDEAVRIIKGIKRSQLLNLNNSSKIQCRDILLMISKFSFYDNIAAESRHLLEAYI